MSLVASGKPWRIQEESAKEDLYLFENVEKHCQPG